MSDRGFRPEPSPIWRAIGVAAAIGLGAVALVIVVVANSKQQQTIGILIGLWAALLGFFAGPRRGNQYADDPDADDVGDLEPSPGAMLATDQGVVREFQRNLELMLRQEITRATQEQSGQLRGEIAGLRSELLDNINGQLKLERIETTRLIGPDLEALQGDIRRLLASQDLRDEPFNGPRPAALEAGPQPAVDQPAAPPVWAVPSAPGPEPVPDRPPEWAAGTVPIARPVAAEFGAPSPRERSGAHSDGGLGESGWSGGGAVAPGYQAPPVGRSDDGWSVGEWSAARTSDDGWPAVGSSGAISYSSAGRAGAHSGGPRSGAHADDGWAEPVWSVDRAVSPERRSSDWASASHFDDGFGAGGSARAAPVSPTPARRPGQTRHSADWGASDGGRHGVPVPLDEPLSPADLFSELPRLDQWSDPEAPVVDDYRDWRRT